MEMQQLRHFLTIARTGSLGGAAEELNLSQSGISRSLLALEGHLGVVLFERQARGVSMTAEGKAFLPLAQRVWNERLRAIAEMKALQSLKAGRVELCLHSVFAFAFGAEALHDFITAYPDVEIRVSTGDEPDLSGRVLEGRADMAFSLFGARREPGLVYETLFHLPCGVYAPASHPLLDNPKLTIDDLGAAEWVLAGAEALAIAFDQHFRDRHTPAPRRLTRCASIPLAISMLMVRDALTILPDAIIGSSLIDGRLSRLAVETPAGRPNGGLIYRADAAHSAAGQAMLDHLRAAGRKIMGQ
ncbi:LysR family transcriptional regulator [soil metagenome]